MIEMGEIEKKEELAGMVDMKVVDCMDVVALWLRLVQWMRWRREVKLLRWVRISGLWWAGASIDVAVKCNDPSKGFCEATLSAAPFDNSNRDVRL